MTFVVRPPEIEESVDGETWNPSDDDDPKAPPKSGANGKAKPDEPANPLPFVWLKDIGDLSVEPPKRAWFMSDKRSKSKFLRMGKPVVLAADGGTGKSFFWLQVAMCAALGDDLFDTFQIETDGRIALLMGEDDQEECWDRLYRIANAMGLGPDDRARAIAKIGLFPLSGMEIELLKVDMQRNSFRTATFEALIERLNSEAKAGEFTWSFVGLDPLARFAGGNVESDNGLATKFVETVEAIAMRVTGNPCVGVTHHSSKTSAKAGEDDVRGVSGIRNGFRAALTMTKVDTGEVRGVLLKNSKNNLAPEARPLWLVRMDDENMGGGRYLKTGGVLRPATEEEAKALDAHIGLKGGTPEQREAAKKTKTKERFDADQKAVLEALPEAPKFYSREQLWSQVESTGESWGQKRLERAIAGLVTTGAVVDLSGGSRSCARQYARSVTP